MFGYFGIFIIRRTVTSDKGNMIVNVSMWSFCMCTQSESSVDNVVALALAVVQNIVEAAEEQNSEIMYSVFLSHWLKCLLRVDWLLPFILSNYVGSNWVSECEHYVRLPQWC